MNISSAAAAEEYRWSASAEAKEALAGFNEIEDMDESYAKEVFDNLEVLSGTPREYGIGLRAITVLAPEDMRRRDGKGKKGRTLRQIVEAQTAHFSFLKNCQIRRSRLSEEQREEEGLGTAGKCEFFLSEPTPLWGALRVSWWQHFEGGDSLAVSSTFKS